MLTAQPAPPISMEKDHGVLVVDFRVDAITAEQVLDSLRETVCAHISAAQQAILFDCQGLTGRVTSQFFGTLIAIRQEAAEENVLVCLCNVDGPLREAYDITRLEKIIPEYADRDAAIAAVGNLSRLERRERATNRMCQEAERRANMTRLEHVREFFSDAWILGGEVLGPHLRVVAIVVGCLIATTVVAGIAHQILDGPGALPAPRATAEP